MSRNPIAKDDLRAAALSRRSPLYVWMVENYAVFADVVTEAVRPNWKALAAKFGSEGITDADGKPPSHEAVRQTWWKVRKMVKAREAATARRRSNPPAARPPAPVARSAAPPAPVAPPDDDLADLRAGMAGAARKLPKPL